MSVNVLVGVGVGGVEAKESKGLSVQTTPDCKHSKGAKGTNP